ncbi:MAG TPA: RNA polymerase sigma factor [Solirubrobacteraceae bacterium]|jgi:RNA polymerase sigma-70 factor (ECF subfamily)|nr:RNA polymerase sigma factor [Solirubrobacteraceae bacterium]
MLEREHEDEARLLADIAAGDDVAFGVIYRRYLPIVVRWCLVQTGDRELAADLSAEVFAAALQAAGRYRPKKGPPVAWLLGIARHKLLESRRRGRVESAARRRLGIGPVALTDEDLARVDELSNLDDAVLALVGELPSGQRDAVLGRVVEDRSYRELAAELRCSEAVIRKRVSRGLHTLRARMEDR